MAILTYLGAPSKAENSLHYLLVVEGTAEREREKATMTALTPQLKNVISCFMTALKILIVILSIVNAKLFHG